MEVQVNGRPREVPEDTTVQALLTALEANVGPIAVELNRRVLPRDQYHRPLREGDQIEVVTFVGGG